MWVPSHINTPGNELADAAVNRATHSSPDEGILTPVPQTNIKEWNYPRSLNRRQQSVLCRLHIGHCKLTHWYLLSGDLRPMCPVCNVRFTIDQLLIECQIHRDEWQKILTFLIHTNTFFAI
nr:unnamed protein product [Callosobruchus chinensis]